MSTKGVRAVVGSRDIQARLRRPILKPQPARPADTTAVSEWPDGAATGRSGAHGWTQTERHSGAPGPTHPGVPCGSGTDP